MQRQMPQFKIQKMRKTTERLPEEVHVEVNDGNPRTADVSQTYNNDKRFYWIMFKWVGVAGWLSSFWNIITGIALIKEGGDWKNTTHWVRDSSRGEQIGMGITIIIENIVGQILYYYFRPGATLAAKQYIDYRGGQSVWERDEWKYTDFDAQYKYLDEEDVNGSSF